VEAVIFVGVQASGKSSFYRERFFRTHVRLSLDMLRTRHRERLLLDACLEAKQPFVVDNTNPRAADRARYVAPARAAGFRVVGYYFQSAVGDAIRRNAARPEPERIPVKGLVGTYKALELPSLQEGFDALYYVTLDPAAGFTVQDWTDAV
jgi:predicted kinase